MRGCTGHAGRSDRPNANEANPSTLMLTEVPYALSVGYGTAASDEDPAIGTNLAMADDPSANVTAPL